jgi:hypothetical protein
MKTRKIKISKGYDLLSLSLSLSLSLIPSPYKKRNMPPL